MKAKLGLYLHIPFCIQKCLYCDFCSFPHGTEETMRAYSRELCRRLTGSAPSCAHRPVDTVYFGGGTPSLLPIACFEEILACLREHYALTEDCEITCECNPASADGVYLAALRRLGVNRLSIGLQSAHENELRALGRAHSAEDFRAIFLDARGAGFDNISADVMYGIPHGTPESLGRTLDFLLALSPEHISAYGLKIEEGTPFDAMKARLPLPDEDTEWEMYRLLSDRLAAAGYHKYEISNFAKKGKESRHNLRYWLGEEYLGFGVAAHSYFGGERFGSSRNLFSFLAGEDITEERITLSPLDRRNEYLMLRLRLTEGICEEELSSRLGVSLASLYPPLEERINGGFLKRELGRIAFTDRGFFVSNTILSEMLDWS